MEFRIDSVGVGCCFVFSTLSPVGLEFNLKFPGFSQASLLGTLDTGSLFGCTLVLLVCIGAGKHDELPYYDWF